MIIGILKEPQGENRVSLLPEQVETLIKKNVQVYIESTAGKNAFADDTMYVSKGAIVLDRNQVLSQSDVVLSIQLVPDDDLELLKPGCVLLGVYQPLFNTDQIAKYATKGLTTFSMDMIPRTTRAQSMDVLSSQANIAGYKAVLTAATIFQDIFPCL